MYIGSTLKTEELGTKTRAETFKTNIAADMISAVLGQPKLIPIPVDRRP